MNTLYHYTSLNGLLGILQSQSIWATHASYLNDRNELIQGLGFARDQANFIFMDDDYLTPFAWAVNDGLTKVSTDNIFLASFSEKPDLLSQWRGYCPPGAGLCLGFDFELLQNYCQANNYRLEQCVYEHHQQRKKVEELMNECFKRFPQPAMDRDTYNSFDTKAKVDADIEYRLRITEGQARSQADSAIGWLCNEITELAPLFKNEGFHEESEWRVAVTGPQKSLKFRACPSYLAPYIELGILSEPTAPVLREVIIGPNPNQRRCEMSIKALLGTHNLGHVEVQTSELPFNSW